MFQAVAELFAGDDSPLRTELKCLGSKLIYLTSGHKHLGAEELRILLDNLEGLPPDRAGGPEYGKAFLTLLNRRPGRGR